MIGYDAAPIMVEYGAAQASRARAKYTYFAFPAQIKILIGPWRAGPAKKIYFQIWARQPAGPEAK